MSNRKTTSAASNSALLEALRSAGADELLSYNAVDEVRNMAGDNFSEAFNTFKAEMIGMHRTQTAEINGRIDAQTAGINGKIDTRIAEVIGLINTNTSEIRLHRWVMLTFIALVAAFGFFKG